MGSYCFKAGRKYICDWDNSSYSNYTKCFVSCSPYSVNGNVVPVSKADFTLIGGFAGVLFGVVFIFALFKSLISG